MAGNSCLLRAQSCETLLLQESLATGKPLIRTLTSLLLTLVLAILMMIGGFGVLASMNQETPVVAAAKPAVVIPKTPVLLEPLGNIDPLSHPPALPGTVERHREGVGIVDITDAPPLEGDLGVALLDGESMAVLGWQRLDRSPSRIIFEGMPEGLHWAVLSHNIGQAHSRYIARTPLEIAGQPPVGHAKLNGTQHSVEVFLQHTHKIENPPLVTAFLSRMDDPCWQRPATEGSWNSIPFDKEQEHLQLQKLAAGTYRLVIDGFKVNNKDSLIFTVPEQKSLTLKGKLRR